MLEVSPIGYLPSNLLDQAFGNALGHHLHESRHQCLPHLLVGIYSNHWSTRGARFGSLILIKYGMLPGLDDRSPWLVVVHLD